MIDETLDMLADAAAAFAKPDAARVRRLRTTAPGYDRATWASMAGQGWLSILVPEDLDGLGLGMGAATVIAERLGFALHTEPYVAAGVMAPQCVARCGRDAARTLLSAMLSGDVLAVLAWQAQGGRLDADQSTVTATAAADSVVLNGESHFVPVAAADVFIVAARSTGGPGLYRVARGAAGLTVTPQALADGSAMATLAFAGVRVPAAACLASGGAAEAALRDSIDSAVVATSAELVGVMERCLEMTLEYLRTRKQFGKAIGSFQALQHRAVDLWMQKELARAAVAGAARVLDDPAADSRARALAASGAKARAAQAALLMITQSVQLHGAIGFTDEYDLGLYLNHALVLAAWMGNAAEHRRRYGELTEIAA